MNTNINHTHHKPAYLKGSRARTSISFEVRSTYFWIYCLSCQGDYIYLLYIPYRYSWKRLRLLRKGNKHQCEICLRSMTSLRHAHMASRKSILGNARQPPPFPPSPPPHRSLNDATFWRCGVDFIGTPSTIIPLCAHELRVYAHHRRSRLQIGLQLKYSTPE